MNFVSGTETPCRSHRDLDELPFTGFRNQRIILLRWFNSDALRFLPILYPSRFL